MAAKINGRILFSARNAILAQFLTIVMVPIDAHARQSRSATAKDAIAAMDEPVAAPSLQSPPRNAHLPPVPSRSCWPRYASWAKICRAANHVLYGIIPNMPDTRPAGGPWRETRFCSTDREVVETVLQPRYATRAYVCPGANHVLYGIIPHMPNRGLYTAAAGRRARFARPHPRLFSFPNR
jgi:hypothetical protein